MKYGCLAPKFDMRDFKIKSAAATQFPQAFQVKYLPKVKNQGAVCSCVAHATAEVLEYFNHQELNNEETMATDFIYGMQDIEFGRKDKGMYLRDACKIVQKYGDLYEEDMKGNTEQPRCGEKVAKAMNDELYKKALINKIQSYARCVSESDIKHALMSYGPLLVSIKWYDKYKIKDNVIYMDKKSDYGYHAIMIYGWNEKGWLCQNSWGKLWNCGGRFIYPKEDKLSEVWSFVDAENSDIYEPKRNKFLDALYKMISFIIN